MTPMAQDLTQWNKDWERNLRSIKARDIFQQMSRFYSQEKKEQVLAQMRREVHVKIYQNFAKRHDMDLFLTATGNRDIWLLLSESKRTEYILSGIRDACEESYIHQDGRMLCPELSVKALLKEGGQAFMDFIIDVDKIRQSSELDDLLVIPCAWIDTAAQKRPQPLSAEDKAIFDCIAFHRSNFICLFISTCMESFSHDLHTRDPSVAPALGFAHNHREKADGVAEVNRLLAIKGPTRCQNCKRRPEDIGPGTQFSVCAACKKQDINLHYCSRECQKANWPYHKKICGDQMLAALHTSMMAEKRPEVVSKMMDKYANADVEPLNLDYNELDSMRIKAAPGFERSPALEHQYSLASTNLGIDYFLYDISGHRTAFVSPDSKTRFSFNVVREHAFVGMDIRNGVAACTAVVQFLLKHMSHAPMFSREIIMQQMVEEYGDDIERKVEELDQKSARMFGEGRTLIDAYLGGLDQKADNKYFGMPLDHWQNELSLGKGRLQSRT